MGSSKNPTWNSYTSVDQFFIKSSTQSWNNFFKNRDKVYCCAIQPFRVLDRPSNELDQAVPVLNSISTSDPMN